MDTSTDKKFDTFVFDLDGTLLDTLPDLILLANRILEEEGFPIRTGEEIRSFVGAGVRRLIYLAVPDWATEEATERCVRLWSDLFQEYYKNTHPYPKIEDTLEQLRLRGCGLGVVSNKLQAGVDQIMSICLPGAVDVMYGESPLIPRKPDPKGIKQALRMLKTAPEDAVYVGDSPSDIKAAKNAEVFSVGVTLGYHAAEDFEEAGAKPDLLIDDPSELLALAIDRRNLTSSDEVAGVIL